MIRETVTVDEVLDLLNEAVKLDSYAITALLNARVPCNEELGQHPTIQVGQNPEHSRIFGRKPFEVGFLGVLNGLFGVDETGYGAIAANTRTEDGHVLGFCRVKDTTVKPPIDTSITEEDRP